MDFLKPLFFKKYRPTTTYNYQESWENHSFSIGAKNFSIELATPKENAVGTVVLAHPMKSLGKYYFIEYGHTNLYLSLGYNVVLFDFNGFGESDDRGFDFPNDVVKAIEFAKKQFPNLPLFLHGVSFGASQIILGSLEVNENINGLVVESAVSSNLAYYKGRGSRLYHLLNLYNNVFPKKNEHNIYTKMVAKLNKTPLLFIYGTQDVITPLWMGEKLFKAAKTKKQLEVFDTKHLTTITEEPEKYTSVIQTFLARHSTGIL